MIACDSLTSCSTCNIEDYCLWSSGACTSSPSYTKSMNTYRSCSSSDSMVKYCYNYVNTDTSSISNSGTTIHHQAFDGGIPKGTYCQWQYKLDYNSVNRFQITRNNFGNELMEVFFQGTQGETLTYKDNQIQKSYSSFDVYNAVSVRLMVVTKVDLTENDYNITATQLQSSSQSSLVGLISIILGACVMIVICTCCFAIMRVCLKMRMNSIRLRQREFFEQQMREEHNNRLQKLLSENPEIMLK